MYECGSPLAEARGNVQGMGSALAIRLLALLARDLPGSVTV